MTVNGELNVSSHFKIHGLDVKKHASDMWLFSMEEQKRPAKEK